MFGLEIGHEYIVVESLHAAFEKVAEDEGAFFHDTHVAIRGIRVLPILNGIHETVLELVERAQQLGFDKIDHGEVLAQVILQRSTWKKKNTHRVLVNLHLFWKKGHLVTSVGYLFSVLKSIFHAWFFPLTKST